MYGGPGRITRTTCLSPHQPRLSINMAYGNFPHRTSNSPSPFLSGNNLHNWSTQSANPTCVLQFIQMQMPPALQEYPWLRSLRSHGVLYVG